MAGTGNVTVAGNVVGNPGGARSFGPITITAATAVESDQTIALSSGNNTITVPTGATCVFLTGPNGVTPSPNPTYGGTLTIKGVAGDTGTVMSAKWPTLLAWDTAPASFVINATQATSVYAWFM
jgi:hypothetical protein